MGAMARVAAFTAEVHRTAGSAGEWPVGRSVKEAGKRL